MTSTEFAKLIEESKESYSPDEWWSGRCPAHDDENPSLGWRDGDAKIVIKCQAECTREEILAALGLSEADTWLRPRSGNQVAETYDYLDEAGALLFQAVRYVKPDGKKTFSLRRRDPDDSEAWVNNIKGTRMVLYRLDKLQRQQRAVIVEGEKDADRLSLTGLAATTNPMGAGKWRKEYTQQLVDAGVVFVTLIPDLDEPGVRHMRQVAESCLAAGIMVRTVWLSEKMDDGSRWYLGGGESGDDASDFLDRYGVDELFEQLFGPDTPAAEEDKFCVTAIPDDPGRIAGLLLAEMLRFAGYQGDGGAQDIEAMAEALAAIDPKEFAPLTALGLLEAWAASGSALPAVEPGATKPYEGDEEQERADKPIITLSGDPDADIAAFWRVLIEANDPPTVFTYGDNTLFKVQELTKRAEGLGADRLRLRLIRKATWVKKMGKMKFPVSVKPDTDLLKMMLVDDDTLARRMPRLKAIVRAPVFSSDGRLVQEPGYDAESGIYLALADGLAVPPVSPEPSQDEVDRARGLLLDDVLVDFPFTGQADRAATIALALLPFARDFIDGPTPLHVISAAKPGTGKSLLLEAVTTIALGRGVGSMTEADNEEETRKRITAKLLEEPTYVVFENLNKMLRGGAIAQALTGRTWEDRILHVSKIVSLQIRCCWVAVANNPTFSPEVGDRMVTCRMVSNLERPRDRDPKGLTHPNLTAWVRENRGELVWACLTIVQNWVARGRRPGSAVLGSFQTWAETMSGILEAAGVGGLLDNRQAMLMFSDPVGDSRKAFIQMWYADFKTETKRPSELVGMADAAGLPVDAGKVNKDGSMAQSERSRMGAILKDLVDQVFTTDDGAEVTVAPGDPRRDRNGARWRLGVVKAAPEQDEYMTGGR